MGHGWLCKLQENGVSLPIYLGTGSLPGQSHAAVAVPTMGELIAFAIETLGFRSTVIMVIRGLAGRRVAPYSHFKNVLKADVPVALTREDKLLSRPY
jgi:hypothetical protein